MIAPNAATTGRQHPPGVAPTSRIVHFIGIRTSPAPSLTLHPSSDYSRRFPSVDSSLGQASNGGEAPVKEVYGKTRRARSIITLMTTTIVPGKSTSSTGPVSPVERIKDALRGAGRLDRMGNFLRPSMSNAGRTNLVRVPQRCTACPRSAPASFHYQRRRRTSISRSRLPGPYLCARR